MNHPASYILREWLLLEGYIVWSDSTDLLDWKGFQGSMPNKPDNAVCLYDTTPQSDGRLMVGTVILHPGVQVKVRSLDYMEGFRKAEAIRLAFQAIRRGTVTLDECGYLLSNVSPAGGILHLGPEISGSETRKGSDRRWLFTLNLLCTISPAPALTDEEELAQVKAQ